MKRLLGSALAVLSLCAATAAFAHDGYVTANVTLRAGPDRGYPGVLRLHAGAPIGIEGCVDGWSWCDVVAGDERGWVPGAYLQEEYDGRRVLVRDYGVRIGIPVVSFVFGDYWDNYYSGRSWYGHRERWSHVHPRYYSGSAYGHSGGSYGYSGGSYNHSGGSYRHSGGSYDRSGGAYGQSAGSYDRSAGAYGRADGAYAGAHDGRMRDTQRSTSVYSTGGRHADAQRSTPVYSTSARNGDGRSGAVTMQQGPTARPVQSTYAQPQPRVIAESRSGHGYGNGAAATGAPPRSASGEQHSAAGQQRAADVHARNAARHSEHARSESDQDKDRQGQR